MSYISRVTGTTVNKTLTKDEWRYRARAHLLIAEGFVNLNLRDGAATHIEEARNCLDAMSGAPDDAPNSEE